MTCPSYTSVFQDTCTYYCNHGYQLEDNRQTRCSADGTWSSEPVTCTVLKCNDPEVEIANSQSYGVCNVTYGSSCSLNCLSGYSVSGHGEHVCDVVNDEGTTVKWRSVGGTFDCTPVGKSYICSSNAKYHTFSNPVDNPSNNDSTSFDVATGGIIVGILLLITVIILLVLAVIIYIRNLQKKQKNSVNPEAYKGMLHGEWLHSYACMCKFL